MRAGLISQLGKSESNANNAKNSIKQLKRASSVILLCDVWIPLLKNLSPLNGASNKEGKIQFLISDDGY